MSLPTLDRVLDAVFRIDGKCELKFISEAGQRWLGLASSQQAPRNFLQLVHPQDQARFQAQLVQDDENFTCDLRLRRSGTDCWVNLRGYRLTGTDQMVLCLIDISEWKASASAFQHAAEHDELTGLPNRAHIKRMVESLIQSRAGRFCMALLDLDGFKKVNDTFGHAIGDAVLVETTRRLRKLMSDDEVLARLGGDEFVILFKSKTVQEAREVLARVLLAVARPFDTAPHNAYLGVSIGLAEYPLHGDDYSTVLKNADTAMYFSKNAGKNQVTVYSPSEVNADFSIKAAIHKGIQQGEFFMEFQPQFDMERRMVGAEALMRWTSGEFGRVAPDKFIPVAEESGLMPFLGRWALRYACHQLKQFLPYAPDFVMSVNVSPVQFGADDFDRGVLETVMEANIPPRSLILEITESTLMKSQERTERALVNLKQHGIRFSIDDFGTGFSSLAYLTRLPVSSIKIDKAFVRAIESETPASRTDRQLVTAMINLAHSIDLNVLAEGVETEAQMAYLKSSGCDLVQGYLTGRPMAAQQLLALVRAQQGGVA